PGFGFARSLDKLGAGLIERPRGVGHFCLLFRRGQQQRGRRHMSGIVVESVFVDAIEEGGQAVIVALLDRVKFVVVTAATLESERQKCRAEGVDAVGNILSPPFLFDATTLVGLAVQTVEGGGQALWPS